MKKIIFIFVFIISSNVCIAQESGDPIPKLKPNEVFKEVQKNPFAFKDKFKTGFLIKLRFKILTLVAE